MVAALDHTNMFAQNVRACSHRMLPSAACSPLPLVTVCRMLPSAACSPLPHVPRCRHDPPVRTDRQADRPVGERRRNTVAIAFEADKAPSRPRPGAATPRLPDIACQTSPARPRGGDTRLLNSMKPSKATGNGIRAACSSARTSAIVPGNVPCRVFCHSSMPCCSGPGHSAQDGRGSSASFATAGGGHRERSCRLARAPLCPDQGRTRARSHPAAGLRKSGAWPQGFAMARKRMLICRSLPRPTRSAVRRRGPPCAVRRRGPPCAVRRARSAVRLLSHVPRPGAPPKTRTPDPVRIEQQRAGLQGAGAPKMGPALRQLDLRQLDLRQLDLRQLQRRALTTRTGKVRAPVELKSLSRAERQRNKRAAPRSLSGTMAVCTPIRREIDPPDQFLIRLKRASAATRPYEPVNPEAPRSACNRFTVRRCLRDVPAAAVSQLPGERVRLARTIGGRAFRLGGVRRQMRGHGIARHARQVSRAISRTDSFRRKCIRRMIFGSPMRITPPPPPLIALGKGSHGSIPSGNFPPTRPGSGWKSSACPSGAAQWLSGSRLGDQGRDASYARFWVTRSDQAAVVLAGSQSAIPFGNLTLSMTCGT